MDCIGKTVTYKMKIPPGSRESDYSASQRASKTGTITSLVVKLDRPSYASGFGMNHNDTSHVQVGGPNDSYELVASGGKRKTRKGRKSRKGRKATRRH